MDFCALSNKKKDTWNIHISCIFQIIRRKIHMEIIIKTTQTGATDQKKENRGQSFSSLFLRCLLSYSGWSQNVVSRHDEEKERGVGNPYNLY